MMTYLKLVRLGQGLRQWELAQKIGISHTKLSMIETGRLQPTDDIKKACAKVLKVPVKALFKEQR